MNDDEKRKKSLKQIAAEDALAERRFLDEREKDIWREFNNKLESMGKQGNPTKYLKILARGWDILEDAYTGPEYPHLEPMRDLIREAMLFMRRLFRREAIRRALTNPTPEVWALLEEDANKSLADELDWEVVKRALETKTSIYSGMTEDFKERLKVPLDASVP